MGKMSVIGIGANSKPVRLSGEVIGAKANETGDQEDGIIPAHNHREL